MGEDLFYTMNKSKLGIAVIINNLDHEQTPTRRDVEVMGKVLKDIGMFSSTEFSDFLNFFHPLLIAIRSYVICEFVQALMLRSIVT